MLQIIENIARIAYEVNRAYCIAIGDNSFTSWEDAPEWQKKTNIDGVLFNLNYPEAKPDDSHKSWYNKKAEQGWVYGPVKDPDKKEHPCMLLYEELPAEQKVKDYLFKQVVESLKDTLRNNDKELPEDYEDTLRAAYPPKAK